MWLLCHFKQTLKLNFHIWLASRTRLCFGQNMLCDKQAQRYTGSGWTWMISENAMLYDRLKMLYTLNKKKRRINWIVIIYYFCASFLGQFILILWGIKMLVVAIHLLDLNQNVASWNKILSNCCFHEGNDCPHKQWNWLFQSMFFKSIRAYQMVSCSSVIYCQRLSFVNQVGRGRLKGGDGVQLLPNVQLVPPNQKKIKIQTFHLIVKL